MAKLDTGYCKDLAKLVDACLLEKKLTRKDLVRPGLSKSNLENFFIGNATAKTIRKIELVLNRRLLEPDGKADLEHGEYTAEEGRDHVGIFLCMRPFFTHPGISTYFIEVSWSDLENCLVFQEKNRIDGKYSQKGEVYITKDHPFLNLLTIDEGAVRNILLSIPAGHDPYYRGVVTTFAKPSALSWVPACAPFAMRRLDLKTKQDAPPLGGASC